VFIPASLNLFAVSIAGFKSGIIDIISISDIDFFSAFIRFISFSTKNNLVSPIDIPTPGNFLSV